ncbi:MAG: hypothetical protein EXR70_06615 [Deltaproteobacteria bacterium]|nr:hypothetical protein [Deltaproteobacteria bacterium]
MTASKGPTRWTEQQFQEMLWHDNAVHGVSFRNPDEDYSFDLIFDIDHVVEWIEIPNDGYEYIVSPATLTFHDVDKVVFDVKLNYKENLEINFIDRQDISTDAQRNVGYKLYRWKISLHSQSSQHENVIVFESSGFTQELRRDPIRSDYYRLDEEQR